MTDSNGQLERVFPNKENLETYLDRYPDHRQRYDFAAKRIAGKNVGDIACGAGYGTYKMSVAAKRVYGYDVAAEALEHARKNFKLDNNQFFHADEIVNHQHDVVVSLETIEHMDEKMGDEFLKRIHGSLAPGGQLIISTPNCKLADKHNVTPWHIREYSIEEFQQKLAINGFKILESWGQGNKMLHDGVAGLNLMAFFKSGLHKLIPKAIRRLILSTVAKEPIMTQDEGWQDLAVQLYVCEK
jgi:2-polyprenyl-3-methyl-5-hydroxy-6-metoxy-1,4-benzoquinol methylase